VSGRWFRYVQAEIRLPSEAGCARLYQVVHNAATPGRFLVGVGLGLPPGSSAQLTISDTPTSTGCGRYVVSFATTRRINQVAATVNPGDRVVLSVYFDRAASEVTMSVTDLTANTGEVAVAHLVGAPVYASAQVIGGFSAFTAPAAQFAAFRFTDSAATTRTGHRGTLLGPWTTRPIVMTSNGQAHGAVEASSSALWDGGRNFSVWVRTAR
jgi:hypothetical protein